MPRQQQQPKPLRDPLINADDWCSTIFDKVANGDFIEFKAPTEKIVMSLRFRWYLFKKKYLAYHLGERSPQANYIRSSCATIDLEPTGFYTLRIGQIPGLEEYNRQVADRLMTEMMGPVPEQPLYNPVQPPPYIRALTDPNYKPETAQPQGPSRTLEAQGLHPSMSPAEFAEFSRTAHLYNLGMCTGCGEPQGLPHSVSCSHFLNGELKP